MLYASSRAGIITTAELDAGLDISKKLEASSPSEISASTVQEEFHPQQEQKAASEQIKSQQVVLGDALSQLISQGASKQDIDSYRTQAETAIQTLSQELANIRNLASETRNIVTQKLAVVDSLTRSIEEIAQNVNHLKRNLENSHQSTKTVVDTLKQDTQNLASTIEKSTSFGFWTYFLFIQAIFFFGYLWWRKHKEDTNKKLW